MARRPSELFFCEAAQPLDRHSLATRSLFLPALRQLAQKMVK